MKRDKLEFSKFEENGDFLSQSAFDEHYKEKKS